MSTAGGCLCAVFSKVLLKVFGCTAQICWVIHPCCTIPGCPRWCPPQQALLRPGALLRSKIMLGRDYFSLVTQSQQSGSGKMVNSTTVLSSSLICTAHL